MNFKTTSILIVLLAVVLGIVMFTSHGSNPVNTSDLTDQPASSEGPKLMDTQSGHVTRVTIIDSTGQETAIQKTQDQWGLTSPIIAPATDYKVLDLITTLVGIRSHGRPASDPGSDSGLDHPKYHVTIETEGSNKVDTIDLGSEAGVGDVVYGRVNGGDINFLDSSLEKTLKTAADDVRDDHLFTIKDTDVKQFRLFSPGQVISGEVVDNKWKITEPTTMPGDTSAISSFLTGVTGIEATKFLKQDDPEIALAGFAEPGAAVWLSTDAPSTQPSPESATEPSTPGQATNWVRLRVGSPDSLLKENYFAEMSDGTVAKIAATSLDSLKKTPLDLRDRDIVNVNSADVTGITVVAEHFPAQAGTQPMAVPDKFKSILTTTMKLVTRPPVVKPVVLGPSLPTTTPSTEASTEPSTQPAAPVQSKWQFAGDAKSQVDDSKVQALLDRFTPLRADSYHQTDLSAPTTTYHLDLITPQATYHFEFQRPANGTGAVGIYDGLTFDIPMPLVDSLDADFHQGK
ncbi:MAG: DUF4340 domain-containing protein [Tepidisphaeraceae bacterium]|jgi:hypothetical protein